MKITMCADFKLYQKNKITGDLCSLTKDYFDEISPGGFTFVIDGKEIPFDWDAQSTNEENGIFHYESGYGPFFNDFEISECYDEDYTELGLNREEITAEFLASTTAINDFYIFMITKNADTETGIGNNKNPDYEFVIELLSVSFEERSTGNSYEVNAEVLKAFNNYH